MDENVPLKMCFISDAPETPTQKLVQAKDLGLLAYAEAVGNGAILMCLNEIREVEGMRYCSYNKQYKCDLYNESFKVTTKAT